MDEHELAAPLRQPEKEREQRGAREQEEQRRESERRRDNDGDRSERGRERERPARGQLPARDRAIPLDRMQTVALRVPHVVDEVGRARRRAVRDEDRNRLEPAVAVAELRREDEPREQQQVLRPLLWSQRRECGARHDAFGSSSAKREPLPGFVSTSIRPPSACASSDAIASPRPVPPPSRDQNGRKIRSRSSAGIPGPVSATETATAPFSAVRPSSIRPPSGVQRK